MAKHGSTHFDKEFLLSLRGVSRDRMLQGTFTIPASSRVPLPLGSGVEVLLAIKLLGLV